MGPPRRKGILQQPMQGVAAKRRGDHPFRAETTTGEAVSITPSPTLVKVLARIMSEPVPTNPSCSRDANVRDDICMNPSRPCLGCVFEFSYWCKESEREAKAQADSDKAIAVGTAAGAHA